MELSSATRPSLPHRRRLRVLQMKCRQIGRSGLKVSNLVLGTMSYGGQGMVRNGSRLRLLHPYWHQKADVSDRLSSADRALLDQYPAPSR